MWTSWLGLLVNLPLTTPCWVPPAKAVVAWRTQPGRFLVLLALFFCPMVAWGQTQAPPASAADSPPQSATSSESSSKNKHSRSNEFLIHGTLFTDVGLALPGAKLRIRRAGEKKFHWESFTNSRGEFAVRVPQGSDYQMLIRAKGFTDELRSFDAKSGISESTLTVQMKKPVGGKS